MFESLAEEAMGRRINLLFRLTMIHVRNEMKGLGIGAGDYAFLILLFIEEGKSQDELSRLMRVDKSYTTRALAKLEKMDMVRREPDPVAHRIKRVYLTRKARGLEPEIFRIIKNWNEVLIRDIDPADCDVIRKGMDQMAGNAAAYLGLEPLGK